MTRGCYILLQNPLTNNYPYLEVVNCCLDIFDEILIVDGGTTDGSFELLPRDDRIRIIKREWKEDAGWDFLCQQYDFGFQNLTTDWRVKMDADYIFHENDIQKIKELLDKDEEGYSFQKCVFNLVDRYRSKANLVIAINKKRLADCYVNEHDQFISGGRVLDECTKTGIKLYVYDSIFKTKENISNVMYKWAIACWDKYKKDWGYKSKEDALRFYLTSSETRIEQNSQNIVSFNEHPKYIKNKISKMTEDMAGYSLFGYKKASYFENN